MTAPTVSAPLSAAPSGGRFSNVDALRALAALLVVWIHTAEVFAPLSSNGTWVSTVAHQFNVGAIGVVAFFAISGYVIPASLKGEDRSLALRQFGISRFFRLYPAFWISIIPGAFAHYWLWGRPFSGVDLAANFTMLPEWLGAQPAEGLYWTLQIELLFYAACALLFGFRWLHNTKCLIAVGFALLVAHLLTRQGIYVHLGIMFFGAVCRRCHMDLHSWHRTLVQYAMAIFAGCSLVALLCYSAYSLHAGLGNANSFGRTFGAYAWGITLFLLALCLPRIRPGVWTWLGQISYSIYLLHPIVFYPLLWVVRQSPALQNQQWHLAVYVCICIALTIALAAVNYRWIEKPAIRAGERLRGKIASASNPQKTRPLPSR